MGRAILLACLPWAVLLVVLVACLYLILRLNHSRIRWSRIRELHRDEVGGVQSLSFVLTLPFLLMLILLIVQVSQLMIATVVVHYSAYAAARTAIVWIPAEMTPPEGCNRLTSISHTVDQNAPDTLVPILDATDPNYGPADGGLTYIVEMSSDTPKVHKIITSAGMALMPICPSRDLGLTLPTHATYANGVINNIYQAMAPSSASNSRIPARLRNKLAYAMLNTEIGLKYFHKNKEPPLVTYLLKYDEGQFYPNEMGWQDTITVTVYHDLALLPGPGRLLARTVTYPDGRSDLLSTKIQNKGNVYTYPLHASATMQNEGEISVLPYVYF